MFARYMVSRNNQLPTKSCRAPFGGTQWVWGGGFQRKVFPTFCLVQIQYLVHLYSLVVKDFSLYKKRKEKIHNLGSNSQKNVFPFFQNTSACFDLELHGSSFVHGKMRRALSYNAL